MTWREEQHPRDDVGRFRDKAGGWVAAVSDRMRRTKPTPTPEPVPTYEDGYPDPAYLEAQRARDTPGFGGIDLIAAGRSEALVRAAAEAATPHAKPDRDMFPGRMLYRSGGVGPHGDEALHVIAEAQGFEVPAQHAGRAELDEGVRLGDLELWRGVDTSHDGGDTPPAEIHRRFREGQAYQGLGMAGNGTYMSSSRSEASRYGSVARYSLHRDARVVGYRTIQREQAAYLKTLEYYSVEWQLFADTGRYAAARGWDAIIWYRGEEVGKGERVEDEVIVLNRGALVAEVP